MTSRNADAIEMKDDQFSDILVNAMKELMSDFNSIKDPKTGKVIKFNLKPGDHIFLRYKGLKGELYCYTAHADTNGNYWCWTYKPTGKGSRSGQAKRWKLTDLVRCAKRKTAHAKALHRLRTAKEKVT